MDVRSYNARLILQLLRWNTSLTKSQIGRATNLSANAVSVIIRALDEAGLILKDSPIRGRVGQPSTPVRLNPAARHYLGLKIGRRSADLVVIDFVGTVLARASIPHVYPEPTAIRSFLRENLGTVLRAAKLTRARTDGFGIAIPSELWSWSEEIGIDRRHLDVWRDTDPASLLPSGAPWTPLVANDATAACMAETTFHRTGDLQDAMYLFIGSLIGGGVVLNGSVFFGRSGNAGGFGPFRIPGREPRSERLIDQASLVLLERAIGGDPAASLETVWTTHPDLAERWLKQAADGIAKTIVSSLSVIDFQAVIIDGNFPPQVRSDLVRRVRSRFNEMDLQGINDPEISEGHLGAIARAAGAAALPLNKAFAIDQNTLLRTDQALPQER